MITDFFLYILNALINALASILPTASTLPSAVFDWIPYFKTGASIIGVFLPMGQFYAVLGLTIIIEGSLLSYRMGVTVFRWIRG